MAAKVKIGKFRDRASELIRRAAGGETIVILNRDREVAKIVPIRPTRPTKGGLLGAMRGTARIVGDLTVPIDDPDDWFQT